MESQPRERVEERQKLEVKENYWSGYQRLRNRTCVQKKISYPTPVAGRRTLQVKRATWKSHNWKGRYPKKNEIMLKRNFLLLTLKLQSMFYVLALIYKKIRLISRIMKLKPIIPTSYYYSSWAVCTCFPSDLNEFFRLLALSNLAFLLTLHLRSTYWMGLFQYVKFYSISVIFGILALWREICQLELK